MRWRSEDVRGRRDGLAGVLLEVDRALDGDDGVVGGEETRVKRRT